MYVVILNFVVSIILCKYFANECKESFTLNLPSAAKYYANISFISNKYKLN